MTDIPYRLFEKAEACGLECIAVTNGNHRIKPPGPADWELTCHQGRWVLTVNRVPQMHLQYEDVLKFLGQVVQTAPRHPPRGLPEPSPS